MIHTNRLLLFLDLYGITLYSNLVQARNVLLIHVVDVSSDASVLINSTPSWVDHELGSTCSTIAYAARAPHVVAVAQAELFHRMIAVGTGCDSVFLHVLYEQLVGQSARVAHCLDALVALDAVSKAGVVTRKTRAVVCLRSKSHKDACAALRALFHLVCCLGTDAPM
jgi:hypothetical protein